MNDEIEMKTVIELGIQAGKTLKEFTNKIMGNNIDRISTRTALQIVSDIAPARVSLVTLITWCRKYRIGTKVGGRWWVDRDKLIKFLKVKSNE